MFVFYIFYIVYQPGIFMKFQYNQMQNMGFEFPKVNYLSTFRLKLDILNSKINKILT